MLGVDNLRVVEVGRESRSDGEEGAMKSIAVYCSCCSVSEHLRRKRRKKKSHEVGEYENDVD